MRKKRYPSDMSRERFEQIRPILEQARKRTKPRSVDLYEVWCAVLYLLRTGCQWRSLLCDSGYTRKSFAQSVRDLLGEEVSVQFARRSELHTFKVMPKRWVLLKRS